MSVVLSALAFVLLLTVLVIVHELGHFFAARWAKVHVEEFGFGLPPRAKSLFTWQKTLFSLNWIPFGGFVRLQGENSIDPEERFRQGSFAAASIPARITILVAGVFMNFVVAIVLFTLGFWLMNWVPTYLNLDDLRAAEARGAVQAEWALHVSEVMPEGNAARAGVEQDSVLKAIDETEVHTVDDVLALQAGKNRGSYTLLTGESYTEERVLQVPVTDGKTGIALSEFALSIEGGPRSFGEGLSLAVRETWVVTIGTIEGLGSLVSSLFITQRVPQEIAGIVGIAQLTHNSLQEGVMVYIRLIALLSLSLAVLNILPFPALDGGRMVFVCIEMLTGRPVNRQVEVVTNGAGIIFLMLLMAAVTWNDIARIVSTSFS